MVNHKKAPNNKPIYMTDKNDPQLEEYKEYFDYCLQHGVGTIKVDAPPEAVDTGDVYYVQQMVLALQHYPSLIEQCIFAIDILFEQVADSELYFPEEHWKTEHTYYKWFNNLNSLPVILFFLRDQDARFYVMAGDFLADKKVTLSDKKIPGKRQLIGFAPTEANMIANRLFTACWLMMAFCNGSGFNPKHYIEAVLAEFDMSEIMYKQVEKQFKKDLAKGLHLKTGA